MTFKNRPDGCPEEPLLIHSPAEALDRLFKAPPKWNVELVKNKG